MNRTDLSQAKAEVGFLNRMSARSGISRLSQMSIQTRIDTLQNQINKFDNGSYRPAKAVITYKGSPVWGSHGIAAEFGSLATAKFTDAIAAVAASIAGGILAERGPIPNRAQNQILITGHALGSFGFEFEEAPPSEAQLTLEGVTPVAQAFDLVADLLEASVKGDEELSEPLSRISSSRPIAALSEFLEKLASSDAYCTFRSGSHEFSFLNSEQVKLSRARLNPANIYEAPQEFIGQFLGAFPDDRRFEFKTQDGYVIHGRIGREIEEPAVINQHLNRTFTVILNTRKVGNGKPRYSLSQLPW
ncbi:hypothetical protein [Pseudomonas luteola]|uniref:hypothetical protein n=1 Tax=Pseudomonas luteola TaxID=47886 RepID=UPI00123BB0E6|nr:hypothetical protein [Pseudomonas luteola]QEU28814.1 hypothetical protein FOB45_13910 [Pseudomonas luteola]